MAAVEVLRVARPRYLPLCMKELDSAVSLKGECTKVDGGTENTYLAVTGGSIEAAAAGGVVPCVSDVVWLID
jgi:hypothetical protein